MSGQFGGCFKGKLLKTPFCVESAHAVIERMSDQAHRADDLGCAQGGSESMAEQIDRYPPALPGLIDRELAQQQDGHRFGAIALLGLGQIAPLDLRGAQGEVTDEPARRRIRNHADARDILGVIGPSVAPEPCVESLARNRTGRDRRFRRAAAAA